MDQISEILGESCLLRCRGLRPRGGEVAKGVKQDGEVGEVRRGRGMLGTERVLVDLQRALMKRPRAREVTLVLKQEGEAVEARGGVGMPGAERVLTDLERALEKGSRLRISREG